MARAVAESRPPESSTTAGERNLLPRHVAPEVLVKLDLEAHRQAVLEDPVRQLPRRLLLVARGEQHRAAGRQRELTQLRAAPLVVGAATDHELDEVGGSQARELLVA